MDVVSLISFLRNLSFVYRRVTVFFFFLHNLVYSKFAEDAYQLLEFPGRTFEGLLCVLPYHLQIGIV